jgi:hypothetical protein
MQALVNERLQTLNMRHMRIIEFAFSDELVPDESFPIRVVKKTRTKNLPPVLARQICMYEF